MALRLNPLPTQTFALPQMASLRSPKFRMASTLRSGSKSVLYLSDLLLLTQFMHFSFFFSLTSFFTLSFFFSVFSISLMSQTKPNNFENHAICWCFVFFYFVFEFTFLFSPSTILRTKCYSTCFFLQSDGWGGVVQFHTIHTLLGFFFLIFRVRVRAFFLGVGGDW